MQYSREHIQGPVHSIRVDSIDLRRAEEVAKLQVQNQALYDGLEITMLSWLNRGHAPGKTHGSRQLQQTGGEPDQAGLQLSRRQILVPNDRYHFANVF
jgi:hypothetical protein